MAEKTKKGGNVPYKCNPTAKEVTLTCHHCKHPFTVKLGLANAKRQYKTYYCTRRCQNKAREKVAAPLTLAQQQKVLDFIPKAKVKCKYYKGPTREESFQHIMAGYAIGVAKKINQPHIYAFNTALDNAIWVNSRRTSRERGSPRHLAFFHLEPHRARMVPQDHLDVKRALMSLTQEEKELVYSHFYEENPSRDYWEPRGKHKTWYSRQLRGVLAKLREALDG